MTRAYPDWVKTKLEKENSKVVSATTRLKFLAPKGKKRLADILNHIGALDLAKEFPGKKANEFNP